MRSRYVLAAGAVVATLGTGSAVAWAAAGEGPGRSVWSHAPVSQMHAGAGQAGLGPMTEACEKAMKDAGMMDAGGMRRMMGGSTGGFMDGGMMGNR